MAACPAELPPPTTPTVEPRHSRCFEFGGRVVDAGALEPLELVHRQAAVAGARRDDHGAGGDLAAIGEDHDLEAVFGLQPDDLARCVEAGAESLRLDGGPGRQVASGDAVGEPDVVLDPRAGSGLPTLGDGVEGDGVETLRGAVHRGPPSRPGRSRPPPDR